MTTLTSDQSSAPTTPFPATGAESDVQQLTQYPVGLAEATRDPHFD